MKQKLLVCGATGFIGRNIAEAFAAKGDYEVYGTHFKSEPPKNPKIKMLQADLTDKREVYSAVRDKDIIIQAAAVTSGAKDIVTRPYQHISDNAIMNSLIFRAAYEHKVSHLVFFSCSVIYDSSAHPLKETDFDANRQMHASYFGIGWTKLYIEKMCEFYSRLGPTRYTVIRHSNIYGPFDKFDPEKSHVFAASINKVVSAVDGEKIIIWGSGEEERDLLYVSDLVNAVGLALRKQKHPFELYNIGYGSSISVRDLVRKIIEASGKALKIEYDLSKPTIKTKLCLDCAKAEKLLGWTAKVSLREGTRMTMDWYKSKSGVKYNKEV